LSQCDRDLPEEPTCSKCDRLQLDCGMSEADAKKIYEEHKAARLKR
jgi:hypothetical protein